MCNNANRCPEDPPAEHRHPPTSPPWARDALRTNYKPECGVADVRNFSIRPCCPGSDQGTRVADRRKRSAETVHHSAFPARATRVRAATKQKRDEAMRRRAHREALLAKLRANDRVQVEQALRQFYHVRRSRAMREVGAIDRNRPRAARGDRRDLIYVPKR